MKSRLGVFAAAVLALTFGAMPGMALAEDPVNLNGAYVLDQADVVGGEEDRIEESLDQLSDATGTQLFVVYVDSFTGAADRADWANTTAELSQLGTNDILLAISVNEQLFQFAKQDDFPLSNAELDSVANDYLVPPLRDGDWAGGAIGFAQGLTEAQSGAAPAEPGEQPQQSDDQGLSSIVSAIGTVILTLFVIVVVVVALVAFFLVRSRRGGAKKATGSAAPTQKELDDRAGTVLVALDDEIESSEQELGFAIAEFGDAATAEFSATLASAKAKLTEAFGLRQRLDDAEPDSDQQKREWTTRIIELCTSADAELDAQAEAFVKLRELEKTAPALMDSVEQSLAPVRHALEQSRVTLGTLQGRFAPSAVTTVVGNPDQAEKLLELAQESISAGREAFTGGKLGAAAVAARTAEASVGQAKALSAAVQTASERLTEAAGRLDAEVAEAKQDVAEATAADSKQLASVIGPTQAAIDFAFSDGAKDPVGTLARLERNAGQLNQAMTGVRERQAQLDRATGLLSSSIATARARIDSAADYLSSRRGGVRTEARTRLSSARRMLESAVSLSRTDPVAALAASEQAASLADQAVQLAQSDIDDWSGRGGGGDATGALVGGVLAGLLLGGGGRGNGGMFGGGSGSGSGGMFGGGGGGFGGGGGGFSGGFGGSGGSFGGGGGGFSGGGGRF